MEAPSYIYRKTLILIVCLVLSCDPSGERTKCGNGSLNSCPDTCCVDSSKIPNCYFKKNGRSFCVKFDGSY